MRKVILATAILLMAISIQSETLPDSLKFSPFGVVKVYKPAGTVNSVVLFISGDGGWNQGVIDMTKNIVREGAMVVGIDIWSYLRTLRKENTNCYYPAGDLEELSMMIQKRYNLDEYHKPILVGYSSGATLAYGALVQAPENTFKGAITLGFCPDIEIGKPLCEGSGLNQTVLKPGKSFYLEPCTTLTAPFIALLGLNDEICKYSEVKSFMKGIKMAELIELPKVGHGFGVTANWLPQFIDAYKRVNASHSDMRKEENTSAYSSAGISLPDRFPIKLIPAAKKDTLPFVFMISGDGGWTNFDNSIGKYLSKNGMGVIGLDAQKYFWKAKTSEETSKAVVVTIRHYMQLWKIKKFVLVGYSFGACVVPFIANDLPSDLKFSLAGVYCLSPDRFADFEIHIADMLSLNSKKDKYNVLEEFKKISSIRPVCIFGDKESSQLRTDFLNTGVKILIMHGDHHYNNNVAGAAETIYKEVVKHD